MAVRIAAFFVVILLSFSGAMAQTQPAAADPQTPKGTLKLFLKAVHEGDKEAIQRLLTADSDLGHEMIDVMVAVSEAAAELQRAAVAYFGTEGAGDLTGRMSLERQYQDVDQTVETIDGDMATLEFPGRKPVEMHRVNGVWRMDILTTAVAADKEKLALQLRQMNAMALVFKQAAADITAGQYRSAGEAKQSIFIQVNAVVDDAEPQESEEAESAGEAPAPTTQP